MWIGLGLGLWLGLGLVHLLFANSDIACPQDTCEQLVTTRRVSAAVLDLINFSWGSKVGGLGDGSPQSSGRVRGQNSGTGSG